MTDLVDQNMTSNISAPSLTFKGWYSHIAEKEVKVFSHVNPFTRWFIRYAVKGGRVFANKKAFRSPLVDEVIEILQRYSALQTDNISELMQWYSKEKDKSKITEDIKKLVKTPDDFLMAFDGTSLYPSAMADVNSEYPKAESARAFKPAEEKEFLCLFNAQQFRPKTAILKVKYFNPPNLFLQHIAVKEKVQVGRKKYELSRFRNGYIIDTLTSVDIQEIVRAGGRIDRIYEGIVYEENYEQSPFRSFILKLFDLRLKYKAAKNEVGDNLIKLLMNSLYGKTVQRDIKHQFNIWSEATLKENFDETIMDFQQIKSGMYVVQKKEDSGLDCVKARKRGNKTRDVPTHLGAFILAHSRRIMNNFIIEIDGFKNLVVYYSDTDSIYVSLRNYDKLKQAGYVGGAMGQGKNDYGEGGIIFGLFLAPKVKYCITLTENGILEEKKTFKGFNKDVLTSKEFFQLATGESVSKEFDRPWKKDFGRGVNKNDKELQKKTGKEKQTKTFTGNINILKRHAPNERGDMMPYFVTNCSSNK